MRGECCISIKNRVNVHRFRVHRSGLLFLVLFVSYQVLDEASNSSAGAPRMIVHILKLSPASAGLCIVDLMPHKAHSGLRCTIALHTEENE